MRPRHEIPGWLLTLLRPFFRFSESRQAYVLRLAGQRFGPVLRRTGAAGPTPAAPTPPVAAERTDRFSREGARERDATRAR